MRPNRQAIYNSAALFYIPAPETFYRGIRTLQAGEIVEAHFIDHGEVLWKTRQYCTGNIAPDKLISSSEAVDQAQGLLTTAIQRQLESEVLLGSRLSGGIDSSLVSAAAQRALQGTLQTYNVRFSDRKYDETSAALAVAQHIGSHHVTLDRSDS